MPESEKIAYRGYFGNDTKLLQGEGGYGSDCWLVERQSKSCDSPASKEGRKNILVLRANISIVVRDNKDPYAWIDYFNTAFEVNGWSNNKKVALTTGFLGLISIK
ncbi:hypothetical protein GLOIN_2v1782748 [Rhizophagus clarus]|uniref:Uncharacterized protein n=1 Tax=Rhizophagus clarus TaxID=94130 RepID=A0A8H3L9I6_9GLOM|nr:hypothetical protein GLOIN_2v1782748 [Rhizophagus clarus]